MDEKGRKIVELVQNGHNIIYTGQCGTGKTFLLRSIIEKLTAMKKKVAVTATTGMAALNFKNGTTIHHWSGIGDCRFRKEHLASLMNDDEGYAFAKDNIKTTDVLVIDEIGMMSSRVFDMTEFVCRHVRGSNVVFGGIQVIASGDFKQLRPVPNAHLEDSGDYCFSSDVFQRVFPHRINLTAVLRQDQEILVNAVKELCDGQPSQTTCDFLRSLDRPVDGEPVLLFGSNMDVDFYNQDKLDALDEVQHIFKAKDKGNSNLLRNVGAMKVLALKVGAPVILLRNITSKLVNGMQGKVYSLENGKDPVIEIDNKLVTVKKVKFDVYDINVGVVKATRLQFPLKLAFALTVHRAQGQTLQNVEIDSYSFFAPGQLGVAVGRAVKLESLRIRNFNKHAAFLKHSPEVYGYYEEMKEGDVYENLACCRQEIILGDIANAIARASAVEENISDDDDDDDTDDDDDDADDDDGDGYVDDERRGNDDDDDDDDEYTFNDDDIIDCLHEVELQPFIDQYTSLNLPKKNVLAFATLIEYKLKQMLPVSGSPKEKWVSYFTILNTYLGSEEYVESFSVMFRDRTISHGNKNKFATRLVLYIQDSLIKKSADQIGTTQNTVDEQASNSSGPVSDIAKAKVRYVAGSCMSKLSVRLRKQAVSSLTCAKHQNTRRMAYKKQHMLTKLRIPEAVVCKTSEEQASLSEITYKQGPTRGLFHISDPLFCFFLELHITLLDFLSNENFTTFGNTIYIKCRNHIFKQEHLCSSLCGILSESNGNLEKDLLQQISQELFFSISEHYLRIIFVDRLHSVKESMPKKKKQALRAKIAGATKGSKKKRSGKRTINSSTFICPTCGEEISESPMLPKEFSIGCDGCDLWYHMHCQGVQDASELGTWKCSTCLKGSTRNRKDKAKKMKC